VAIIVKPTEEEWEVISRFLRSCESAAVVIPPGQDSRLRRDGIEIEAWTSIAYDFGGDPDLSIDILEDNPCALDAIKRHLGVETDD